MLFKATIISKATISEIKMINGKHSPIITYSPAQHFTNPYENRNGEYCE